MELLIIIGIMFAWQAFSSWDAEQTDETIGIRKKMKDEARWRDLKEEQYIEITEEPLDADIDRLQQPKVTYKSQTDYTSPMSIGHALDIVRAWPIHHPRFEQVAAMVMESEGLNNAQLWDKYHNYTYTGGW